MSTKTSIQWTDATWNIARGCSKVDDDCKFCYMYRDSYGGTRFNPYVVTRTKTVFELPLKIKEPSKIFTCSYTDFFHEGIDSFRNEAWGIIRECPQHTFQILTKRPERISKCLPDFWEEIKSHVWLGTSVGSDKGIYRIYDLLLLRNYADILFVSFEPLYGFIDFLGIPDLDWVIIGGESGNDTGKYRYRPCKIEWIEHLISDFGGTSKIFVKQLGTHLAKELKFSDRHGGDINEFPPHLRIREFPNG